MTPAPGSQPNSNFSWALSGAANYIAPSSVPQPNTVFVTVTLQADPSRKVQATITILGGTGVSPPITQTTAANQGFTLSASVSGLTNAMLNWTVNGIAGGNMTFGQIVLPAPVRARLSPAAAHRRCTTSHRVTPSRWVAPLRRRRLASAGHAFVAMPRLVLAGLRCKAASCLA
jgi:hypothetical protein